MNRKHIYIGVIALVAVALYMRSKKQSGAVSLPITNSAGSSWLTGIGQGTTGDFMYAE